MDAPQFDKIFAGVRLFVTHPRTKKAVRAIIFVAIVIVGSALSWLLFPKTIKEIAKLFILLPIGAIAFIFETLTAHLQRLTADPAAIRSVIDQMPGRLAVNVYLSYIFMGASTGLNFDTLKARLRMLALFVLSIVSLSYTVLTYADVCELYGIVDTANSDPRTNVSHAPGDCLYFSLVTWTTLGYGDFRPTVPLRLFAAAEAVTGYVYMGLFAIGLPIYLGVTARRDK
jgi:Ion channel